MGTRLKPACFACPTNLLGHPLRPLGRSGCGTALRMTGWWHPVGSGGWGWGEGGEPQARGSWRVKNSSSRVSVSKCGGGELEAGRRQAVFAHSAGLFPPGPRHESPGSCRGGAGTATLALGSSAGFIPGSGEHAAPFLAFGAVLITGPGGLWHRGEVVWHSEA